MVAMATLTDVVAAVVVHSSALAFSHFGIALEPPQAEATQPGTAQPATAQPATARPTIARPTIARVVARSPRKTEKPAVRARA